VFVFALGMGRLHCTEDITAKAAAELVATQAELQSSWRKPMYLLAWLGSAQ